MTTPSNHVGDVAWYIVTAADQVTIPDFVFHRDEAPYLIGQLRDRRIVVFNREAMAEILIMWQKADNEMNAQ